LFTLQTVSFALYHLDKDLKGETAARHPNESQEACVEFKSADVAPPGAQIIPLVAMRRDAVVSAIDRRAAAVQRDRVGRSTIIAQRAELRIDQRRIGSRLIAGRGKTGAVIGRADEIVAPEAKVPSTSLPPLPLPVLAATIVVETVDVPLFATMPPRPIPAAPLLMVPEPPAAPSPVLLVTVHEVAVKVPRL
jgi:hypothetical protein